MLLRSNGCAPKRRRREPERGVLQRFLIAHLESFIARARTPGFDRGLPHFVKRELYRYLQCGRDQIHMGRLYPVR